MMKFALKNDEFCIENDEFCIEKEKELLKDTFEGEVYTPNNKNNRRGTDTLSIDSGIRARSKSSSDGKQQAQASSIRVLQEQETTSAMHASFQLVVMSGVVGAARDVKWFILMVLNVFGR